MNAVDYKNIMNSKNLVESPETVKQLANAKACQQNILILKKWNAVKTIKMKQKGIDRNELIKKYYEKKDEYIKLALRKAWDRNDVHEALDDQYFFNIEVLKKNIQADISTITE